MASRYPLHGRPPYVSFTTLLRFLDWLEQEGMPQRFDRSFWSRRLSGTYGAQMTAAFRFLGLIDRDDAPALELEALVFRRAQRKAILREILQARYPSVFELDLTRATAGQLEDKLREFGLQGDTLRKAETFFVHAAQFAEVPLSTFILNKAKPRVAVTISSRRQVPRDQRENSQPPSPADASIHPILAAMLSQLSERGPSWTADEKQRWLNAFSAALDLLYPPAQE